MRKVMLALLLAVWGYAEIFSGCVVRGGKWDNYGFTVRLESAAHSYAAVTAVNGRFALEVAPDNYQLSVVDQDGVLVAAAQNPDLTTDFSLRLTGAKVKDNLLLALTTLVITAAMLLLAVLVWIVKRPARRSICLPLLAGSFALYTATDAAQDLLALSGLESLAGALFFLKHIGLVWFGYLFFRFWRVDFDRLRLLPWSETLVLCTWPLLGLDSAFEKFWFFSFAQLRLLIMLQLFLFLLSGILTVFLRWLREKDNWRKRTLAVTQSVFVALLLLFSALVVWPLLYRQGAEFFDRQYILTALIFGLIIFVWLSCAEIYQHVFQTQLCLERQERLSALGKLASGLAHEIKNPLAALHNLVAVLPENYRQAKFRAEFMDIVPRQIERINHLVSGLLDLSRAGDGQKIRFNLSQLLEKSLALLAGQAVKQNVQIERAIAPDIWFKGQPNALEQVFLDLGLNALQAMPQGGVLKVTLKEDKTLTFQDNGCGIRPEILPHIFDPFVTTKKSGNGLGLSIVKKILDEHKVKIEISAQWKQGAAAVLFFY
jgi:signal transduction histidine kinase